MASGLPVVSLDLPGVRDLVTDGREGFVAGSVEELSERLGRLVRSPELRVQMSGHARQRALDFTAERFAERAKEFYEEVVGGRT
jgi:glycosyltransferase involved in cell wall biosynthesis